MDSISDSLIKNGLNFYFKGSSYGRVMRDRSVEHDSIILNESFAEEWFELLSEEGKQSALEYATHNFPTIYDDGGEGWKGLIETLSSKEVEPSSLLGWYGKSLTVQAASLNPNYNWKPIFDSTISERTHLSYISPAVRTIVDSYSECDSKAFYDYVFKNVKNHKWEVRALLYSSVVKNGTLTPKMARKIRSDGAAKASRAGLNALISNISLYPDNEQLFVQFVDTTYEEVAYDLARGIPDSMITYMVGTGFFQAKRIIRDRMTQIELNKEREEGQSDDSENTIT